MDKRKNDVFLSLGTNLGEREKNLTTALNLLQQDIGEAQLLSSIYETEPWGEERLAPFYNLAVHFKTELTPQAVLSGILAIEDKMGRERGYEKGYINRIIDIDLLFYNNELINTDNLIVPHPYLHLRNFVLKPLEELAPNLLHPLLNKSIQELLLSCTDEGDIKKVLR